MDDTAPSLEQQMAAQARIREAAGISDPKDTRWAMGCAAILGIGALAIILWMVIVGSILGWWVFLTW